MTPDPPEAAADAPVIRIHNLGKCYHIYNRPQDRLKQALLRWRRTYFREFWALRAVSFEVARGEAIGIVGRNGSGKSTLLQLIAGTLAPTEGSVEVAGRVGALLELGSGFNPEFTGRENVYLNGAILGLSSREMDDRFDAIAAFADIGEFLDQPVKTYSSGMMLRLAFAVQVQVEPEILIVDEALAVGDALFQKRCYERLEKLRTSGTTILFVSHDQESVRTLTDRALLLDHGRPRAYGTSAEVLLEYRRLLHEDEKAYYQNVSRHVGARTGAAVARNGSAPPAPDQPQDAPRREGARSDRFAFGDLEAEIISVRVLDGRDEDATLFYPGDRMKIEIACRVNQDLNHLNLAFRLRNKQGVKITSWGTLNEDIRRWHAGQSDGVTWDLECKAGQVVRAIFECDCPLGPNFYEVQATVTQELDRTYTRQRILHWRDEAAFFNVGRRPTESTFGGVVDLGLTTTVAVQEPAGV